MNTPSLQQCPEHGCPGAAGAGGPAPAVGTAAPGATGAPVLRPGLPRLIPRIAALPLDERGYPVPYFVAWLDGKPDFRIVDPEKLVNCVRARLCWVCGQGLGAHLAFAIGPMCVVTRTTSEPPSHLDCALWSMQGCPFLSRPEMVRREDETTNGLTSAGNMLKRNPGVMALWVTKDFKLFPDGKGSVLFKVGEPSSVSWWMRARPASRLDVLESIATGMPALTAACGGDPDQLAELQEAADRASRYLPQGGDEVPS